jgi:hypothetical protein
MMRRLSSPRHDPFSLTLRKTAPGFVAKFKLQTPPSIEACDHTLVLPSVNRSLWPHLGAPLVTRYWSSFLVDSLASLESQSHMELSSKVPWSSSLRKIHPLRCRSGTRSKPPLRPPLQSAQKNANSRPPAATRRPRAPPPLLPQALLLAPSIRVAGTSNPDHRWLSLC